MLAPDDADAATRVILPRDAMPAHADARYVYLTRAMPARCRRAADAACLMRVAASAPMMLPDAAAPLWWLCLMRSDMPRSGAPAHRCARWCRRAPRDGARGKRAFFSDFAYLPMLITWCHAYADAAWSLYFDWRHIFISHAFLHCLPCRAAMPMRARCCWWLCRAADDLPMTMMLISMFDDDAMILSLLIIFWCRFDDDDDIIIDIHYFRLLFLSDYFHLSFDFLHLIIFISFWPSRWSFFFFFITSFDDIFIIIFFIRYYYFIFTYYHCHYAFVILHFINYFLSFFHYFLFFFLRFITPLLIFSLIFICHYFHIDNITIIFNISFIFHWQYYHLLIAFLSISHYIISFSSLLFLLIFFIWWWWRWWRSARLTPYDDMMIWWRLLFDFDDIDYFIIRLSFSLIIFMLFRCSFSFFIIFFFFIHHYYHYSSSTTYYHHTPLVVIIVRRHCYINHSSLSFSSFFSLQSFH